MNISLNDFDEGLAKYEKTLEIAKKMLTKGIPIEDIIEITGLSEEEIRESK